MPDSFYTRPWREYTAIDGQRGTDELVNNLFGFPPDVLTGMWEQYRDVLPNTNARKGEKQAFFALAFRFIKLGPRVRELHSVLFTPQTGHCGKKKFYRHIVPILLALAEHVNMINWENRLDLTNHAFVFPVGVTGIVVRFNLRVTMHDRSFAGLLPDPCADAAPLGGEEVPLRPEV